MGYRSEVFYGAEFENEDKAITAVIAAKLKFGSDLQGMEIRRDDRVIYYHCMDIKWYDSYPEVQFINELFDFFANDCEAGCMKYRIGEDINDIEHDTYGDPDAEYETMYNTVWVSRQMDIELGGQLV